ncbi:DMT family transporter [Actinospica durhamensis]|uniref:DMT family transporter n=1 Tax=Actinospica durhamensis TaxID=1508375 RepID=A0A941EWD9_9ACTN|nr:DMT family transporter [Actinospica durhamensis]MBR7838176.1 DMT family transporter [Actinospica durhamensis]
MHRPPAKDVPILALAVLGVGTSGPLIAATRAAPLAIAVWRNALGAAVLTPFALLRHREELRGLRRTEWITALLAGLMLGLHFATWTPSLSMTSVASATAFVATQPMFAAFIARLRGEHVAARAWLGIVVAFLGVIVLSGVDLHLSQRAFVGDLSALCAAVFAAIYMTLGARVRQTVSLTSYTSICYSTASLTLVALALITRQSLLGFDGSAWLKICALTAGAQLLGHTLFNRVLKTTSPTVVSVVILLEVPIAALIALFWLHQVPSIWALPGALLILAGLVAISTAGQARGAAEHGAEGADAAFEAAASSGAHHAALIPTDG